MSKTLIALVLGCTVVLVGCRTVWEHPEASAEKYREDRTLCQYGMTPAELVRLHERHIKDPTLPLPWIQADWKRCMVAHGWFTRGGTRLGAPWGQSAAPAGAREISGWLSKKLHVPD